ncbi:MAG: flavodoxin family protein [Desulfovibrio sp.]|nr:flavodoxin family protein [Desulfovibrio sp.]
MKNILVVLGGGREKGNTFQLVQAFMAGAREAGHTVKLISLNEHVVEGCRGCNVCRFQKPCIIDDDFNGMIPEILGADCLIFASPLYFWTFSAKIKAFVERLHCLAERDPHPPHGRRVRYPVHDAALIMAAADDFCWTFEWVVSYYRFALINYIGFHDRGMLLAGGCDEAGKPAVARTPHLQRALHFGRSIYACADDTPPGANLV